MSKPFGLLILSFILVSIAVVVCYFFVDRQVAIYMAEHHFLTKSGVFSQRFASFATFVVYLLLVPGFYLYFYLRSKNINNKFLYCFSMVAASTVFSFFLKTALQFLFGRESIHYAHSSSVLFLRNPHLYRFDWFAFGSCFPSGHMSVLSGALIPIALIYPKTRWFCYALLAVLAAILIITDYHFVSDVIAGLYVGTSTAMILVYLSRQKQAM